MTPEGYEEIVKALKADRRHGGKPPEGYEVTPKPENGHDVVHVTVRRSFAEGEIIPGNVLYALGKAGLLSKTGAEDSEFPRLIPVEYGFGSITFEDVASEGIYETPSES